MGKTNYGTLYIRCMMQRLCVAMNYFTKDFGGQWKFIINEMPQRLTIEISQYNPRMQCVTHHGILLSVDKHSLNIMYSRYSSYINAPITKERMLIIIRKLKNELKRYETYNM